MKIDDIQEAGEYTIMVPTKVRVIKTGLPLPDGCGGERRAGVLCQAVESGMTVLVRCDRIKNTEDIPWHRANLS